MSIKEYFGDWLKVIDEKELMRVVKEINLLYKTHQCEPEYTNIFKAFHITPFNELCVISLAQDPYYQKGVPTGVSFGNKESVKQLSPSLQVIKEAVINFEVPHNLLTFDPTLEEWSRQGILLLNSALTVEVGKPNSHSVLWRPFISSLLKNLSLNNPGLIYILWGSEAKTFENYIQNTNIIYKMPHPSYFARTGNKIPYTFFRDISREVKQHFDKDIIWYKELIN